MPVAIAPGGHQHDLAPAVAHARRCRRRARRSARRSGPVARRGDQAGADLDHEPAQAPGRSAWSARAHSRRPSEPRPHASVAQRRCSDQLREAGPAAEIAWNRARPAVAQCCREPLERGGGLRRRRRRDRSCWPRRSAAARPAPASTRRARVSIACRSSSGSRPVWPDRGRARARAAASARCGAGTDARGPCPRVAPGMSPGRSAITKVRSPSTRTMPRDGRRAW